LEAHLSETERRLQDTQKLGTSLLAQQEELTEKLREVEKQQDEAEISPELRQRLSELEREHSDVGKEIARALLGPKARNVSGEERPDTETAVYTSQATGSPTKISAPNRRQRNQQAGRAGDLQFAADISTSLLAQVRQLQAAVAEREEALKKSNAEQLRLEQESHMFSQRLRVLDDSEQKMKDENWDLQTQKEDLLRSTQEASDREKRLNAALAAALAEKTRSQHDADESRLAHEKLAEQHEAAKKAHDSEIHTLKRSVDVGDNERVSLESKIDELTAQNQELARAVSAKFRNNQAEMQLDFDAEQDNATRDLSTPEGSPPPSPTKATPRHGGLESDTLRSSLHHAHRMIQNLKNNIHREKTEKIELKRMLQDARDELEQRRADSSAGVNNKRQKTKSDTFKKPPRLEMLGGNRKSRTDVELEEEDWEDHVVDSPSRLAANRNLAVPTVAGEGRLTDHSDAYHTANETEGAFETADERHTTESDDFQTGAESLAGDSTDELTETEGTSSRTQRTSTVRGSRPSIVSKSAGDRMSYMSTASTSAEEGEDELQTPLQPKFRLKNGRHSLAQQPRGLREGTPESFHSRSTTDSPATSANGLSPPAPEHSLFAELGGFDDRSSDRYSTPGRESMASFRSTPSAAFTPGERTARDITPLAGAAKPQMVDSGMMTEPWIPQNSAEPRDDVAEYAEAPFAPAFHNDELAAPSPSDFPLPPSVPQSPPRRTDHSTQYTPQRAVHDSPMRNIPSFITPPKTVWDEEYEAASPDRVPAPVHTPAQPFGYSGMLSQATMALSPKESRLVPEPVRERHSFSGILSLDTKPVETVQPATPITATSSATEPLSTAKKLAEGAVGGSVLASAAAVLGFSKARGSQPLLIAEDETSEDMDKPMNRSPSVQAPLSDVSGNGAHRRFTPASKAEADLREAAPVMMSSNDQGSQTTLTASQIEQALKSRSLPKPLVAPLSLPAHDHATTFDQPTTPTPLPVRSSSRPQHPPSSYDLNSVVGALSPTKRPSSANSQRTSSLTSQQHPPLPPNHKAAIAIASGRVTPSREQNNSSHVSTIMGPPMMPASAMRRPKTPAEGSLRSPTHDNNAPRSSVASRHRGTINSQMSRRSSVSSFASELDERFNIRPEAAAQAQGFEPAPGTDPRMIQAITQTMIGEWLWKYTRKLGRGDEMSNTRHRRYFWVHPYTKTLYWASEDPQTAGGKGQNDVRCVPIESVRAVTDDNAFPPGLHRQSLEVKCPGRTVKFTASTGQRHETWFNALSYLLLRNEDQSTAQGAYQAGGNDITRDDINEFSVGGYGNRPVLGGSRASMSSYNSRTTRGTSQHRQSQALPGNVTATRNPTDTITSRRTQSTIRPSRVDQPREADKEGTLRTGSVSRFSRMLGSVTGRHGKMETERAGIQRSESERGSIYNASIVSNNRDEEEEMRREMLRQEPMGYGGLENVRACCDGKFPFIFPRGVPCLLTTCPGKHDVSTLTHGGRHASHAGHTHRHASLSNRINQSVGRRPLGTLTGPSAATERQGAVQVS